MDININTNLEDVEKYIVEQSKNLRFLTLEHDIFKIAELIRNSEEKIFNVDVDLENDNNEYQLNIYFKDENDDIMDNSDSVYECLLMTSEDYKYYYNSLEMNFNFKIEIDNPNNIEYQLANKIMGKQKADKWYSNKFAINLEEETPKSSKPYKRNSKI